MQHVSHIARTELGFDKFDYHSLRHTHATMLAEKGASPKYVQYRLGHKNIQVTMQIYQHLTNKMSTENAQLLELILGIAEKIIKISPFICIVSLPFGRYCY